MPRRAPILLRSYHPTQSLRTCACLYQEAPPATKLHPGAADEHRKQTAFEIESPASNDDEVTHMNLLTLFGSWANKEKCYTWYMPRKYGLASNPQNQTHCFVRAEELYECTWQYVDGFLFVTCFNIQHRWRAFEPVHMSVAPWRGRASQAIRLVFVPDAAIGAGTKSCP